MFRPIVACVLVALFMLPVQAGRKKEKAGEMEGAVYKDNNHSFALTLHEGWRAKIGAEGNPFRIILLQKNFSIPPDYQKSPDYTQQPRLVVFADTCSISASAFADSLLSETYKSKQKSLVLKEFTIFDEGDLVVKGKRPITVGGINGYRWDSQSNYVKAVTTSASEKGGTRVDGYYGGMIVTVKKGNTMLAFHLICEGQFFDAVAAEASAMINSVQFIEPKATDAELKG